MADLEHKEVKDADKHEDSKPVTTAYQHARAASVPVINKEALIEEAATCRKAFLDKKVVLGEGDASAVATTLVAYKLSLSALSTEAIQANIAQDKAKMATLNKRAGAAPKHKP